MRYDRIIWDFNGTLFDDLSVGFEAINRMLTKRGRPALPSVEYYQSIFGFPIKDYYRKAGFDFKDESYESMAEDYIRLYDRLAESCGLKEGLLPVLEQLKADGIPMYVLSACEQTLLTKYLEKIGVRSFFQGVYGTGDYLAPGKKDAALRLRAETGPGRDLLIGDTSYDGEMAELLGADALYVGWGHHGRERLEKLGLRVAGTPRELLELLTS